MTDIADRKDIVRMVDRFYEKVREDTLLAPIFNHVDWSSHMPVMYNFWSSILLGDQSYQGNPFQKHVRLPIDAAHFTQWLKLFHETIDELFQGSTASEVKDRAASIAGIFQHRMGVLKTAGN